MAVPSNSEIGASRGDLRRAPTGRAWPWRRWHGLVLLCFVAQLILILLMGERRLPSLKPVRFATTVHLVSDTWWAQQLAGWPELSDPAVFALPTLDGFSRSGWLTYTPPQNDFAETPRDPQWLQINPDDLGTGFAGYVASNTPAPLRISDESIPPRAGLQPRPSSELEFPESELHIAGALGTRKLLTAPKLPSWPHTDVLTNSVVQIWVDANGSPISTALLAGSGSSEADRFALGMAKRLRFKPEGSPHAVTSGTAYFRWHTSPPNALTNTPGPGFAPP